MKNLLRYVATAAAIIVVTLVIYRLTSPTTVRRAAFDIGSGTIKYKVADVDPHTNEIVRVIAQGRRKADFKESIAQTPDKSISSAVAAEGANCLREFLAEARKQGATEFAAVGTQAFRQASNGMDYFMRLHEDLGIPATVLTHKQQAKLAFLAAQQHSHIPIETLVVWDIGAASMELVMKKTFGDYEAYLGELASVSFKNHIIKNVQGKSVGNTQSPNPISKDDMQKALVHAASFARNTVPRAIRERLHQSDVRVVGIGPVHAISIAGQAGKKRNEVYTRDDVRTALNRRVGMTDAEVGGSYANVQISNLILVLGFMDGLGINAVIPARINLADGLLVADQLW